MTTALRHRCIACSFALCLGAGCKVGRAVVDRGKDPAPSEVLPCSEVTPCDPPSSPPVKVPVALSLCEDAEAPCRKVELVAAHGSGSDRASDALSDGAELSHALVRYTAEKPIELTLSEVHLSDVRLELAGPLTLHVRGQSALDTVQVLLTAAGGEPRLVIEDTTLDNVGIAAADAEDVGSLSIERAHLGHVDLQARVLELTNVQIDYASLTAESLVLADAKVSDTFLAFDHGLATAADFQDVVTERCQSLTYAVGTVAGSDSLLGPCSQMLRLYSSDVHEGYLDGPIQADTTLLTKVRLGARAPTTLESWAADLRYLNLCEHLDSMRFGPSSALKCVACDPDPPLDACRISTETVDLSLVSCALLADAETGEVPACPQPWPDRERPR